MPDLTLNGLDGTNPLAFMAALGVLNAVSDHQSVARLHWHYDGSWQAVLQSDHADVKELIVGLDADRRECVEDPALSLEYNGKRDLKPRPSRFRDYLQELVGEASPNHRRSVDWASAFATDVATDNNGNTKPTALHFTAGQQQFLVMVAELVQAVTPDDLREAVLGPWRYERPLPVMGWDATSSRDYALRASDPSTDKKLGVPGADWLAIRGLSFFPAMPEGTRVLTTCCIGGWKTGQFRWPLWTVPLSRQVIQSLLQQDLDDLSADEGRVMGVGIALSSAIRRSDQGGYGSFAPASVL